MPVPRFGPLLSEDADHAREFVSGKCPEDHRAFITASLELGECVTEGDRGITGIGLAESVRVIMQGAQAQLAPRRERIGGDYDDRYC